MPGLPGRESSELIAAGLGWAEPGARDFKVSFLCFLLMPTGHFLPELA